MATIKKLKISSSKMVSQAREKIEEVATKEAISLMDDPDVVFIDIRDIRERQKLGFIPGSVHCPRGMIEFWIDPESPYFKDIFSTDSRFIFHCAAGWRSALTVATLKEMGFHAAHLKDGFSDWVEQGGPVEKSE